jgi:hypothetical protein
VGPDTPEFTRVLDYLREVSAAEGLATAIEAQGDILKLRPA